jgi:hypothetical protein
VFSVVQVGACVTGSWCFHPVGAGIFRKLVLPSSWCLVLPSSWCWNIQEVGASIQLVLEYSGSWCFLLVGARETRELELSNKLQLVKQR